VSKFAELAHYEEPLSEGYRLAPLRFTHLDGSRYVISNDAGDFLVLQREDLESLVRHRLDPTSDVYRNCKSKHLLFDSDSEIGWDLLSLKLRTKLQRLADFTALHIFVVSLRCEHSCPYCQVSRQSDDRHAYDMSQETADLALNFVFRSPSPTIKIEFQGGEPFLNFPLVQHIVERAKSINAREKRTIQFVIATNLALLTDEILEYCEQEDIYISTSLDGPKALHARNRPRPGGNSYELTVAGIERVRERLGRDHISALMTTTESSLSSPREIIDEYLAQGFNSIFLRSISPYGFARKTKWYDSYNVPVWLDFYREGLQYILEINKAGTPFVEQYAAMILTKMLTPFEPGYVDLMSPSGIGIAALVYNYDGNVYASDEARMLAEMGDRRFRLGNLKTDSYEQIMCSDALLEPLEASFAPSVPMCSDCAFLPYCGSDPVFHYATQGDFVGKKPVSDFCRRHMGIFRLLIQLLSDSPEDARILRSWVQ